MAPPDAERIDDLEKRLGEALARIEQLERQAAGHIHIQPLQSRLTSLPSISPPPVQPPPGEGQLVTVPVSMIAAKCRVSHTEGRPEVPLVYSYLMLEPGTYRLNPDIIPLDRRKRCYPDWPDYNLTVRIDPPDGGPGQTFTWTPADNHGWTSSSG